MDEHVQHVDGRQDYYLVDDVAKFKLFALTLDILAMIQFKFMPEGSVDSWTGLCENFTNRFTPWKRQLTTIAALNGISKEMK